MADLHQKRVEAMDILAASLDEILPDIYGERVGFALFTFPFGGQEGQPGDWISNAERKDMIKFMREIADRLEAGQDIPRTIGEA
jgi:hypothetical protein